MVTHETVMQTSTGAAHALLTVATGVRGFLLLLLLAHLAQRRSAARSVFSVVHVQVEIGLKMARIATRKLKARGGVTQCLTFASAGLRS